MGLDSALQAVYPYQDGPPNNVSAPGRVSDGRCSGKERKAEARQVADKIIANLTQEGAITAA
jgi:hypothetical protein